MGCAPTPMSWPITLRGGPFDGMQAIRPRGRSLILETDEMPNAVARYRQTRDRDVFRFAGWDRVVLRIPTEASDG